MGKDTKLGALLDEKTALNQVRDHACKTKGKTDGKCADDCFYKPGQGCLSSLKSEEDKMNLMFSGEGPGAKFITFRSNKKPSFSFRIPVSRDTLIGKYRGAIRFSPVTGKLHVCYGPLINGQSVSTRPVLSMLVKDKLGKDLWTYYVNTFRKTMI